MRIGLIILIMHSIICPGVVDIHSFNICIEKNNFKLISVNMYVVVFVFDAACC